ncbi:MAG: transporter substrate-binding domain-containing protein [Campylobacterota bacterium]|nr:transporter substrate-binding domain-containing protein [Campylobacterota bacterium]
MKLLKYFIILLLLITSVVSSELEFTENEIQWIKDNPTVKLGADYRWPPFDFVDSEGKHTGLSSEYIKLVSKKSGLKFEVHTGVWSEVLQNMKAKKYDGLSCAVETDERKKYLSFSDPYLSVPMVIITARNYNYVKTIDELFGKVVSINKGSYIHEWLKTRYPKIKLHLTTSNEASLEAVSLGKADAYVGNLAVATFIMNKNLLNNLNIVTKLKDFETAVSVAIDKENHMLFNIIQKSLNSITINEHQEVKSKWKEVLSNVQESSTLNFTDKEKDWINNNPVVTFGSDDSWAPFDFADNNGKHTGLSSEYIKLVAEKSGLKFDIKTDLWTNVLKDMKSKKYDGLVCAVETQEREKYLKFTNPYLSVSTVLVIEDENSEIKTINDLDGRTLSVAKDSYTHEWLKTTYPKMKLHLSSSDKESLEAVSLGNVDAYIGNLAVATYLKNKHLLYNLKIISIVEGLNTEVSMAVDKEKKVLFSILEKSLKSITPKEHLELKSRWEKTAVKDKNSIKFTNKQKEWISKHKTIKFVIDSHWKPIEYISTDAKKHQGLSSSYLELVSQRTGIEFKIIHTDTWSKSVEKINTREADMYACVAETDSRKKVVNFSNKYITMPQVFVTSDKVDFIEDISKLYGKKVVLVEGYYITEIIKKEHPQIEVIEVNNIKEAFEVLTQNKAFAYIDMLAVASAYIQKDGFSNLKISGTSDYDFEFSMALRNDWDKEGIEVINKALASITEEEKNEIYNKWLHVKYDREIDYTLLWQIIGLFLLFILGTLYWNRKLSIEVKKRKIAQANLIETNKKLEEATAIAQSANKAKTDFLSNMSHEIRTPMNAILGFAELLDEKIEDKKLKSFVKTIRSSGQTLLLLINDILDLSKIESGKLELVKSRSNLLNMFEETINIFRLQSEQKGLKLELNLDKDIPKALLIDEVRLKEILINLIGNAFKFTEEGYIKVDVVVNEVYEHTSKIDLTIMVKDSGIGISKLNQEKIFNIFEQSENQDTKKYGGTGLGLAISKKLAILMGGSLRVESELGEGSNFIVSLKNIDIASLTNEEKESESKIDYSSIKFQSAVILIADDIKENRDLIKESFSDTNIEIIEAVDGKKALEIAKTQELDMIFMDIRMPVMDGYVATRLIKEFSSVPVVALTASIMQEELKKLEGERFSGYLRKPVSRGELFKEVSKYIKYKSDMTEDVEEDTSVSINNAEEVITFLNALEPEIGILYKEAKSTNNISVITDFSKKLLALSLKHNVGYMIDYSELLLEKIDAFEINSISKMLEDYEGKLEKLSSHIE